jgi:hypothetical protein
MKRTGTLTVYFSPAPAPVIQSSLDHSGCCNCHFSTIERTFSAMEIIMTYLRCKMGNEWLNHIMKCSIEWHIFSAIANDAELKHFQVQNRRILV